jgi:Xaa-Pro dipeptidase
MTNHRLEKLYQLLEENGLDAIALNPGPTLTYITGLDFHLMERPVIALFSLRKDPVIILPELEMEQLKLASTSMKPYPFGDNPNTWLNVFKEVGKTAQLEGKNIGLEPLRLRLMELRYLESGFPLSHMCSAETVINLLRIHKDVEEVDSLKKAVEIAQKALLNTIPAIRPGVSEIELASELTIQLLKAGSETELAFSPITSTGPNSADPHATPSDRPIKQGDLLVIDYGAKYNGYRSDITRTFGIDEIEPEYETIYELVKQANAAGHRAAGPGIPARDVDLAARKVIEDGGYGPYFTHRTGHGLGMEAHEAPYIHDANYDHLEKGNVFTIEPGIYLPGRGGVRIEDDVLITETGSESLTSLDRELKVLKNQ